MHARHHNTEALQQAAHVFYYETGYLLPLALELARSRGAVPGGPRRSTCGPAKLGWPEELRGGGTKILWRGELLEGGRLAPLPVPEPLHRGSGGGVGDSCAELEHGLRAELERRARTEAQREAAYFRRGAMGSDQGCMRAAGCGERPVAAEGRLARVGGGEGRRNEWVGASR